MRLSQAFNQNRVEQEMFNSIEEAYPHLFEGFARRTGAMMSGNMKQQAAKSKVARNMADANRRGQVNNQGPQKTQAGIKQGQDVKRGSKQQDAAVQQAQAGAAAPQQGQPPAAQPAAGSNAQQTATPKLDPKVQKTAEYLLKVAGEGDMAKQQVIQILQKALKKSGGV